MLYRIPELTAEEKAVIQRIERARHDLKHNLAHRRRWTGLFTGQTRARVLRGSVDCWEERLSREAAIAAIERAENSSQYLWKAAVDYRRAEDFILQRIRDGRFKFSFDMILALHFIIKQSDRLSHPGNLSWEWDAGADPDLLEPLMDEYVKFLNSPPDGDHIVKAAMAHLNLVKLEPFKSGNSRVALCLHKALLAKEGIVAPEFCGIEEYIGHNNKDYYEALRQVGGRGWHPEREARPWIRFCLTAHYRQAHTLIGRFNDLQRIADEIYPLIERQKLQHQLGLALMEAASGYKVRNSTYRVFADASPERASRDLNRLVKAGLLERREDNIGVFYAASREVASIGEKLRTPKAIPDPFTLSTDNDRLLSQFS